MKQIQLGQFEPARDCFTYVAFAARRIARSPEADISKERIRSGEAAAGGSSPSSTSSSSRLSKRFSRSRSGAGHRAITESAEYLAAETAPSVEPRLYGILISLPSIPSRIPMRSGTKYCP